MQYIASISYGKDSLAMLRAIELLGWPLDRIVHAEVWATDTIPADLPPMVEFKARADKIIKDRWGIEVEHMCATRVGGGYLHSNGSSTPCGTGKSTTGSFTDSQLYEGIGAAANSKPALSAYREKVTYEKLFYHHPKKKPRAAPPTSVSGMRYHEGTITGFPFMIGSWCKKLKIDYLFRKAPGRRR